MKIKLFILGHWMRCDGVSVSLLNLLKELDYSKVVVDLMLMSVNGPLLKEIPREVNLLPTPDSVAYYWSSAPVGRSPRWLPKVIHYISLYVAGVYYRVFRRMKIDPYGKGLIGALLWLPFMPKRITDKVYDSALFFSCVPIMCRRVSAKKTFVWVHTDWGVFHPIRCLMNLFFGNADYIVCVSEGAKRSFDGFLNSANRRKTCVVENVVSRHWLDERIGQYVVPGFVGIKIVSVGRMSAAKNYRRALDAAAILKQRGLRFKWYIVGGGECEVGLREALGSLHLGDCGEMTGALDNPCPYYRWADIFVSTSDWEAKSVSVCEAQMSGLPVVITRYPTSGSQLEEGVDGLIAELSAESVADNIMLLAKDAELRSRLRSVCLSRDYTNKSQIDKILSLES